MLNLITSVSGVIRFLPGETGDSPKNRIRIGYVPQSGSVAWDFPATVLDVVLMGRYDLLGWIKRPGKNDVAIANPTFV